MNLRRLFILCAAAVLYAASTSAQVAQPLKASEFRTNDAGAVIITALIIDRYLLAAHGRDVAGGDYWRSGGFQTQRDFALVEERVIGYLNGAPVFSPEELAALSKRTSDLRAARGKMWSAVNFPVPETTSSPPDNVKHRVKITWIGAPNGATAGTATVVDRRENSGQVNRPLRVGDWVEAGSQISTPPNTFVEIEIENGSVFIIDQRTLFNVEDLSSHARFRVDNGKVTAKIKKPLPSVNQVMNSLEIWTGTSVTISDHTEFSVSFDPSTGVSTTAVSEGSVTVRNLATGAIASVGQGQRLDVTGRQLAERPDDIVRSATPSSGTLEGVWIWQCCVGNARSGTLKITKQNGDGSFVGDTYDASTGSYDSKVLGRLQENRITFDRTGSWGSQRWTGTVTRDANAISRMQGSWTGVGESSFPDRSFTVTRSNTSPPPRAGNACGFTLGSGILAKWQSMGGENSPIKCATGNEGLAAPSPQGSTGVWAPFMYGMITMMFTGTKPGVAFEVQGDINYLYFSMGGSRSWLGFPVSDEYDIPGGRRSDFEGGSIVWSAVTRKAEAVRSMAASSGTELRKYPGGTFCLNLHNGGSNDGAEINLWSCNGQPSQQWQVRSDGTIRNGANPDKCLNLHNHENKDGAVINLWTCTGHPSQQWRVQSDMTIHQGTYSDKCLNLHFNALQNRAVVNLWTCNGHESQKWSSQPGVAVTPPRTSTGCGWIDALDSSAGADPGRGLTNWQSHFQHVNSGAGQARVHDLVGNRMKTLSQCLPIDSYAGLYAAVSSAVASEGRLDAGWIDGMDGRSGSDPGRGISDQGMHFRYVSSGGGSPNASTLVAQRMATLSSAVNLAAYAKLYADISVLIARCGVTGACR